MVKTEKVSSVRSIRREDVVLRGREGSILVVHNFNEKAKAQIRDRHQKRAKGAKEQRDVKAEFLDARYVDDQGRECVPITAFKKALVTAATSFDDLTKVGLRQAIFAEVTDNPRGFLVPILNLDGSPAVGVMREDAVTISMNTRALAYRPQYVDWMVRLTFEFNERLVSYDQLLALIDQAGWGVGVCEGRPEKTSALGWGRFERMPTTA